MRSLLRLLFSALGWLWLGRRYFGFGRSRTRAARPVAAPEQPVPDEARDEEGFSRREFLAKASVAFTGLVAAAAGLPALGMLFTPVARREQIWHPVGAVDEFEIGETVRVVYRDPDALPWAGPTADNAAWLRRLDEDVFVAFSIYCTHTGCPVAWTAGANLFLCPCHGGVFDREGEVLAGPPEEPLVRLDVRVQEGQVELFALPVPVTGERPRPEGRARRMRQG
jgi:menaquinol-cytochrome c reductase iron-sulfur subunit